MEASNVYTLNDTISIAFFGYLEDAFDTFNLVRCHLNLISVVSHDPNLLLNYFNKEGKGQDHVNLQMVRLNKVTKSTTIFELAICREVDNFITYLSDLLSLVYKTSPKTLQSFEKEYSVRTILAYETMDDFIMRVARDRTQMLARQGFDKISKSLTSLKITEDMLDQFAKMSAHVEIRNCIVHHRGMSRNVFEIRETSNLVNIKGGVTINSFNELHFNSPDLVKRIDKQCLELYKLKGFTMPELSLEQARALIG